MIIKRFGFIALAALLAVGCGDDDDDDDGGGGSIGFGGDGGGDAGNGGGDAGNGGGDTEAGLVINAALGLDVTDKPFEGKSNVSGLVLINHDGEHVAEGVTVELNGVELERETLTDMFKPADGTTIPDAEASTTLELVATFGGDSMTLEMPCPDDFQITSPAEGATLKAGDTLTVSWTGDVHEHREIIMFTPRVNFYHFNTNTDAWQLDTGFGPEGTIPEGASSHEVEVPSGFNSDRMMVEVIAPGEYITTSNAEGGESVGICWLSRRVEVTFEE